MSEPSKEALEAAKDVTWRLPDSTESLMSDDVQEIGLDMWLARIIDAAYKERLDEASGVLQQIQRIQPGGSPPPGDTVNHVAWIVNTAQADKRELVEGLKTQRKIIQRLLDHCTSYLTEEEEGALIRVGTLAKHKEISDE